MGSNFLEPAVPAVNNVTNLVTIGGYASVFRSGDAYKAVGEIVQRSVFTALSSAFPRNGSVSSEKQTAGLPSNISAAHVAYGAGLFVAVGQDGSSNAVIFTSPDGKNWTKRFSPVTTGYLPSAIIFAGAQFVVVTQKASSGSNVALTSPDGITWTSRTLSASMQWSSVAYGGGVYVATASYDATSTGTTTVASSSPDGITWTARSMPTSSNWVSVAHNGTIFVATAGGSTAAASSTNGTSWTARTLPTSSGAGSIIAVAANFVMFLGDGIYTTADAVSYTKRITPNNASLPSSGAYGNGVYIAAVSDGVIWTSYDMDNWTPRTIVTGIVPGGIGYGAGIFVSVPGGVSQITGQIYAENLTDSDYLYLSGTAGQFIRVK